MERNSFDVYAKDEISVDFGTILAPLPGAREGWRLVWYGALASFMLW